MNNKMMYRTPVLMDYKTNQKLKQLMKKSKCSKAEIVRRLINGIEIKEKPNEEF